MALQRALSENLAAPQHLPCCPVLGQRIHARPSTSYSTPQRSHSCQPPHALLFRELPETHVQGSLQALDQIRRSSTLNRESRSETALCPVHQPGWAR